MATKKTTTKKTAKSKTEIQEEFNQIAGEVASKESIPTKLVELRAHHNAQVKENVAGLAQDKVLQDVTTLNLRLSEALSRVQNEFHQATNQLKEVQEAVEIGREELREIHKIDVASTALDHLVTEYEQRKQQFQVAEEERQEQAQREEDERCLARVRDEQTYAYNVKQKRKQEQDEFEEQVRQARLQEKIRYEDQDRAWKLREEKLATQEKEFQDLRNQVASFPEQLKAAEAKGAAVVGNTMKKENEYQMTLARKDFTAITTANQMMLDSLNTQLKAKTDENAVLQVKLSEANKALVDLSGKALDSAQERKAFADASMFINQQSNNGQPQKGAKA